MAYSSTASKQKTPPLPDRILGYMRRRWRRTFARGDISAILLSVGLLWMPALALRTAAWTEGLLILLPIIIIALFSSFFLARSRFSELTALLISTLYGFSTIIIAHVLALPGPLSFTQRFPELADRIHRWTSAVSSGGSGTDNLIFAIFLSILFWYLAHNTIWHLIRLERVWRAVIPPGLVLVINQERYAGDADLNLYLIGFLFFTLLLVIHIHIQTREYEWSRQRVRYSARVRRNFMRIGAVMTIVILLLGWLVPTGYGEDIWDKFSGSLGEDVFAQISKLWTRLFSSLEGQGIATTDYYGGDRLDLTGAVQLGEEPVMEISVDRNMQDIRLYWRSTSFTVYDGRGWDSRGSVRAYKDSDDMNFNVGTYAEQRQFTQEITLFIPASSLVYGAPQVRSLQDIAVEAILICVEGGSNCINSGQQADVLITRSRDPLRRNERYSVTSSTSVATADQLRAAGTDYPAWVTDTYLQGTQLVSDRVRALPQQVFSITGAQTPYEKARAIEYWLRTSIVYDETISAPPISGDPIAWFLFDIQRGYCNYYATAMVMMLRSEGIPARMSAGFAQGNYEDGTYLVRENDAHTWVEVYFPGYGWVNFEPTADEIPLERPGDQPLDSSFPTMTPMPTITPTLTPLPTNTPPSLDAPTLTPTPTQRPEELAPGITATPEYLATPTLMPTPSPSPQPPAVTDVEAQNGGGGSILNTIFFIFLVTLFTIMLLILMATIIIWWVEQRGLGGLNPIQKAYARLEIYGRWLDIRLHNRQTPHERRSTLVEEVPKGKRPISAITLLYTEDRFGPPLPQNEQDEAEYDARQAWSDARFAFISEKLRRWRRRR